MPCSVCVFFFDSPFVVLSIFIFIFFFCLPFLSALVRPDAVTRVRQPTTCIERKLRYFPRRKELDLKFSRKKRYEICWCFAFLYGSVFGFSRSWQGNQFHQPPYIIARLYSICVSHQGYAPFTKRECCLGQRKLLSKKQRTGRQWNYSLEPAISQ